MEEANWHGGLSMLGETVVVSYKQWLLNLMGHGNSAFMLWCYMA